MSTEITGGNTRVGTLNRQFVKTIETIHNNNITININVVNCTATHQHQHQDGVSISGGEVHQLIDCLKSVVASCGHTPQIASESARQSEAPIKSQCTPATQVDDKVVMGRRGKGMLMSRQLTQDISPDVLQAVADSVRIMDSQGRVLKPGDAVSVDLRVSSLYVGDGYAVRYDTNSKTVVKEKLDLTQPFTRRRPFFWGYMNVIPPEMRVQRALHCVGKPCPVLDWSESDFVCWTFTGQNSMQSVYWDSD